MFEINSINGSVQWLGVPQFLRTNGPPWTDNILVPSPSWGNGGTSTNLNWGSQPGGHYIIVSVLSGVLVLAMLAYFLRSPEKTRSAARRVRDDLLQDNRTACMQSLSTSRRILCNCLVNWRYYNWDDLWDDPVDQ